MPRYRSKPMYVEAFHMTEDARSDQRGWPAWLLAAWDTPDEQIGSVESVKGAEGTNDLSVNGAEVCEINDWIVQDEDGGLHVVPGDRFLETFYPADEPLPPKASKNLGIEPPHPKHRPAGTPTWPRGPKVIDAPPMTDAEREQWSRDMAPHASEPEPIAGDTLGSGTDSEQPSASEEPTS